MMTVAKTVAKLNLDLKRNPVDREGSQPSVQEVLKEVKALQQAGPPRVLRSGAETVVKAGDWRDIDNRRSRPNRGR